MEQGCLSESKDDRKNSIRMIYQADENSAIDLPERSPVMINLNGKLIKENSEIADKKIFILTM